MSDKMKPIADGCPTVIPHLVVKGAAEALDFYAKAFGAKEQMRMPGPGGLIWHAAVAIGTGLVYLCDEFPESPMPSPATLGGSPVTIHLNVEDTDAVFAVAVEAGATPAMPPRDMFWGARYGMVIDPFGHHWSLSTRIEDVTPEEMRRRASTFMTKPEEACVGEAVTA